MSLLQMGGLAAALIGAAFSIVKREYKDAFTMVLIAVLFVL